MRALHGRAGGRVGLQQCSRAATLTAESCSGGMSGLGNWHYTRFPPHPNRAIYFFLGDSTARVTRLLLPTGARMGQVSSTQTAGRNARQGQAGQGGLLLLLLRPPGWGPFRAGGGRSCVYAMRCGARAGIEAIFRAACGRGYSRTWTQRILGRYADD